MPELPVLPFTALVDLADAAARIEGGRYEDDDAPIPGIGDVAAPGTPGVGAGIHEFSKANCAALEIPN